MNILHVVTYFAPCFSAGGVVNAAYQIAKKQVEDGHNVYVYTTDSCDERMKFDDNYNLLKEWKSWPFQKVAVEIPARKRIQVREQS